MIGHYLQVITKCATVPKPKLFRELKTQPKQKRPQNKIDEIIIGAYSFVLSMHHLPPLRIS